MHQGRHAIDTTYRVAVLRIHARLVRLRFVLLWENAVCGKIDDFEFLLVDLGGFVAGYGRPLEMGLGTSCTMSWLAYKVVEVVALASRGDECALHEELVLAFDGERWVLLHGLEQHWESVSDEAQDVQKKDGLPCTSTLSPGSIFPEFGRTQYCCGVGSCE